MLSIDTNTKGLVRAKVHKEGTVERSNSIFVAIPALD